MSSDTQRALFKAATMIVPVVALALVWHFAGLSSYRTPHDVARALQSVAGLPFGWALVPLGFAAGTVLFVPVNALIIGVTLTFPALPGFLFALCGGLLGACVTYGLGRLCGSSLVGLLKGPRIDRVIESLRNNAFRTSLVLHLLPVGSFTLINLIAGSLRVPFGGFLLGTALGLLPGLVFFTLLGGQLPKVLAHPSPGSVAVVVLAVVALVGVGAGLRRWARRRPKERASA